MNLAALLAVCAVLGFCACAPAANLAVDPCPSTKTGGEWSAQCFTGKGGGRKVKLRYLKRIDANRHGMAVVIIAAPREMVAVDRRGAVVLPNIRHTGDFDYPTAEHGVGRFAVNVAGEDEPPVFKCGYFKAEQFSIVAPAQYDQCGPVRQGEGQACTDCVRYCTDPDCHDSVFVGGKGVVLAPDGAILRTYTPPGLDQVCGTGRPAEISVVNGSGMRLLKCDTAVDSPFKM